MSIEANVKLKKWNVEILTTSFIIFNKFYIRVTELFKMNESATWQSIAYSQPPPPGQTHPQADTPPRQTHPGQTPPLPSACWDTHTPGQTPPPNACWDTPPVAQCMLAYTPSTQCILGYTPRAVHAGIRSTSGRYASYWNAYLFLF